MASSKFIIQNKNLSRIIRIDESGVIEGNLIFYATEDRLFVNRYNSAVNFKDSS